MVKDKHKKEVLRKLIHISSIILPLMYRFVFLNNRKLTFLFLVPLAFLFLIIEIIRLHNKTFQKIFINIFGVLLRKYEINNFTGATYLITSSIVCIAVFPADIAFLSISFLAIGDTLASVVGLTFGKRRFLGSPKSLEGSIACFAGTLLFAIFFINPWVALAGAFTATLAEFSHIPLNDNIQIPVISGIVMSIVSIFIIF